VAASAPSADRPVCHSGNRYCERLGEAGRDLAVLHTVGGDSSDAIYAALGVAGTVDVAVTVVHDAADPPKVSVGRFDNLLNSMTITFDTATNRAGQTGQFSCGALLDLTDAKVLEHFGTGSSCAFTSTTTAKVVFGKGASVVPGQALALNDRVLMAATTGASLYSMNETVTVGQPLVATTPNVYLSASSASVGRCDSLTLDASGSSGSGGRAMTYTFSVAAVSGHSIANLTAALDLVNAANGGKGAFKALVASEDMVPGSTFAVTLTAENFLGNFHSSLINIAKLNVPAPEIKVQGPHRISGTHSRALSLIASAELPTMTCISNTDLSSAKMSFKWFEDTGAKTLPILFMFTFDSITSSKLFTSYL
jgi:hypothetical protein